MKYLDLIKKWMDSDLVDKESKNKISKMSEEQRKDAFSNMLYFGTAGVRQKMEPGIFRMNTFTYRLLTRAFAIFLKEKYPNQDISVVIGRDNRLDGEKFSLECAYTLSDYNICSKFFINNELMPTPVISYAIPKLSCQAGIIVTASHNPKEDNGYKIYGPTGSQLLPKDTDRIQEIMKNLVDDIVSYEPKKDIKMISYIPVSVVNNYIKEVMALSINTSLNLTDTKVVYTPQHGAGSVIMPRVLTDMGYNFIPVAEQSTVDPYFSNTKSSNPEDPISFELALQVADKNKADIILGSDPDADRLGVVIKHNKKWEYMTGNQMGILYLYYNLTQKPTPKNSFVVSSHVSNNLIDLIAKPYDVKVYRTGTGFKWMGNKIDVLEKNNHLIVAFEEAIGALNSTINKDKDSIQSAVLALEIYTYYKNKNMTLVDVFEQEIFPKYGHWFGRTVSVRIESLDWKKQIDKKMKSFGEYKKSHILSRKIKKIQYNEVNECWEWILENNSWIKFRQSGTEPKFKVYFNLFGTNSQELIDEHNEILKELQKIG